MFKPNKPLKKTIEKHRDAAQDYYKAKKMTKVKERKVSDYLSGQICKMGLNSTSNDVFTKIHKERSRKPPTRAPGFKSCSRNLELHLLNSAEEVAKEKSLLANEMNKNVFDKGCACEMQEELTERHNKQMQNFVANKQKYIDNVENKLHVDSPRNASASSKLKEDAL